MSRARSSTAPAAARTSPTPRSRSTWWRATSWSWPSGSGAEPPPRREPEGPVPPHRDGGRADGRGRGRLDHHGLEHRGGAALRRRHPLRGGQGRAERAHRGLRARLRPHGAGELHHARPLPHRHLEGVGPRGLPRARQGDDGARPRRRARRDRRGRALLRLGRVELHHRRGARHPRRRRLTARSPRAPAAEGAPVPEAPVSDAPAEIAPVRSGEALDWAALEAWLPPPPPQVLPEARGPIEALQFPNGSANLTYLLRLG